MPAVNDVGEPCAGEPHARFDGRELETEQRPDHGDGEERPAGNPRTPKAPRPTVQLVPPRQLPTLQPDSAGEDERLDGLDEGGGAVGAAADLAQDLPALQLGVGALARPAHAGVGGVDLLLARDSRR